MAWNINHSIKLLQKAGQPNEIPISTPYIQMRGWIWLVWCKLYDVLLSFFPSLFNNVCDTRKILLERKVYTAWYEYHSKFTLSDVNIASTIFYLLKWMKETEERRTTDIDLDEFLWNGRSFGSRMTHICMNSHINGDVFRHSEALTSRQNLKFREF